MRHCDRRGHQLVVLGTGVPEHHPLVARADRVERVARAAPVLERVLHPERDVGGLLLDRRHHAARVAVDAELRVGVADVEDGLAGDRRDVDVGARGDLAGNEHEPSAMIASRTASEIWSASLSGCPSVTDSEVNR